MRWICLALCLLAPTSAAEGTILWFHDGGADPYVSTPEDLPPYPRDTYKNNALAWVSPHYSEWVFPVRWVPETDRHFLAGQSIEIVLVTGIEAWGLPVWGSFELEVFLRSNQTTFAHGDPQPVEIPLGTEGRFVNLTWDVEPVIGWLPADEPLSWVVRGRGLSTDFEISASQRYGRSYLDLPLQAPPEPGNATQGKTEGNATQPGQEVDAKNAPGPGWLPVAVVAWAAFRRR